MTTCLEAIVNYLQPLSTTPALSGVPCLQVVSPRDRIASITTLRCFVL
jgi:hypothetical protein